MKKFKCPNCSKKTITIKEKLRIDVLANGYCKECGGKVNKSYWATLLLSVLCYWGVHFVISLVHTIIWQVLFIFVIIILLIVINVAFIPLVKGK